MWALVLTLPFIFLKYVTERNLLGSRDSWWPVICDAVIVFILGSLAVESYRVWERRRFRPEHFQQLGKLLQTALLENKLSEAERVLRANQTQLHQVDEETSLLLFDRRLIKAFLDSRSTFHLELLADDKFRKATPSRFRETDLVVRELLVNENSPLRSVINEQMKADERHHASTKDEVLISRTFQNPVWYSETRAGYGILISAIEELDSGKHDEEYNGHGGLYEWKQGRSRRATCQIFHAEKAEYVALTSAINARFEADLYSTDLYFLFKTIVQRSRWVPAVWDSELTNHEHPTPYAYLLYEITHDLQRLLVLAIENATSRTDSQWSVKPAGGVAQQLITTWALCLSVIARSEGKVSPQFRNEIIESYFVTTLKIGWEPSAVYSSFPPKIVKGLGGWQDLLADTLKRQFAGDHKERQLLKETIDGLDLGKQYVQNGRDWLRNQLGMLMESTT